MSCVMLYTVYDASRALISGYTVGTNMTNLEIKAQKDSSYAKSQEYKDIVKKQMEDEDWASATPVSFKVGLKHLQQSSLTRKQVNQNEFGCAP